VNILLLSCQAELGSVCVFQVYIAGKWGERKDSTRLGKKKKKEERKTEMILVKNTYRVFRVQETQQTAAHKNQNKKGASLECEISNAHEAVREREGRESPMSKETPARKHRSRSSSRDP